MSAFFAHVGGNKNALAADGLDAPERLRAILFITVGAHDLGALLGEHNGGRPADTGTGACHNSDFPIESTHRQFSLCFYS